MLALRNEFTNHTSFKELLLEVKQTASQATENQDYPFEILLEKLNLSSPGKVSWAYCWTGRLS